MRPGLTQIVAGGATTGYTLLPRDAQLNSTILHVGCAMWISMLRDVDPEQYSRREKTSLLEHYSGFRAIFWMPSGRSL